MLWNEPVDQELPSPKSSKNSKGSRYAGTNHWAARRR
jgi:hypothetical protein